jgi:hypothetical protein
MIFLKFLAISLMMMSSAHAFNVLVLAPSPFLSNWMFMEKLIQYLNKHGHHVTAITPYVRSADYQKDVYEDLYKEILVPLFPIESLCN